MVVLPGERGRGIGAALVAGSTGPRTRPGCR